MNLNRNLLCSLTMVAVSLLGAAFADPLPPEVMIEVLKGPLDYIQGRTDKFSLALEYQQKQGDQWRTVGQLKLVDVKDDTLILYIDALAQQGMIRRTKTRTDICLPDKKVVFRGEGDVSPENRFDPRAILCKVIAMEPRVGFLVPMLQSVPAQDIANSIGMFVRIEVKLEEEPGDSWRINTSRKNPAEGTEFVVKKGKGLTEVAFGAGRSERLKIDLASGADIPAFPTVEIRGWKVELVDRNILERTLSRGLVRMAEIKMEDREPPTPQDTVTIVPHGRLVVQGGHRLLMLEGTPGEIGVAEGQLLRGEMRKTIDSALYAAGLASSILAGEWFPDKIRAAWSRLEKFVPEDYIAEMRGIAQGSGIDLEEIRLANVFPELFHCSGFVVKGACTADGKLYHGRVLDYMTNIGLQYYAVVAVVRQPGKKAFANIGYAGFTGCVSGINEKKIAIGQMGAGGEGQWDGMPMAHLVRKALEESSTLDEAKAVLTNARRTCGYYYVLSDGNSKTAAGAYATPQKIEFIGMGEAHPRLPSPVKDTVLVSAGDRYQTLVKRVNESYGRIDLEKAIRLMDVGVATRGSNLHNVLFVPEDLTFHVADAGNGFPAAAAPYVKYELSAILKDMASEDFLRPRQGEGNPEKPRKHKKRPDAEAQGREE